MLNLSLYSVLQIAIALIKCVLISQTDMQPKFGVADNQGNFYVVDDQNTLYKIDSLGNELYRYHRQSGTLSTVDATNPFKPLLYFASSRSIVITDNTLSTVSTLELQHLGFTQVLSICRSSDDNIWLFDASDFRLRKLDNNGNLVREGSDMLQQTGFAPDVHFMLEHEQKVYLCDSSRGILVTDLYGNYEKTIALKGLQRFQFVNNQLVYFIDNTMHFYDLRTALSDSILINDVEPFHQAVYNTNRLLTLGENRLSLYRVAKP